MNKNKNVKLSVLPKCYLEDISKGRMSIFEWIEMAEALKPDGLEMYSGFFSSLESGYLKKVRKAAADKGFSIPTVCYSSDFTHNDPEFRKKEVEKQKEMIKVTAELGGIHCRVLSGQRRPEVTIEDGVKYTVDSINACIPTAKEYNVRLVIENHYKDNFWIYPEFALKKEVFFAIVDSVESEWFGVQYDPSNCFVAGDDPIEVLEHVKHRVLTVHGSDRFLAEGHTLTELANFDGAKGYASILKFGATGKGMNDYNKIFAILAGVKFKGWISLEDGLNGMDEMKESMDFLRGMINKYLNKLPQLES